MKMLMKMVMEMRMKLETRDNQVVLNMAMKEIKRHFILRVGKSVDMKVSTLIHKMLEVMMILAKDLLQMMQEDTNPKERFMILKSLWMIFAQILSSKISDHSIMN